VVSQWFFRDFARVPPIRLGNPDKAATQVPCRACLYPKRSPCEGRVFKNAGCKGEALAYRRWGLSRLSPRVIERIVLPCACAPLPGGQCRLLRSFTADSSHGAHCSAFWAAVAQRAYSPGLFSGAAAICFRSSDVRPQRLWRGYTAVVGLIIIVAVSTGDRGCAIVTLTVVSPRGGSTDRSGADRSSAHRHARAVIATTIDAATVGATSVDATTISATTNANCVNPTCANSTSAEATCAAAATAKCGRLV
jgi:hypothetical protein